MPDSLSPVTMTEDYYAKIAGQDVTPPDPATREQKWLDAIAGRVDGLAEDVEDLGDIVPTPEAADSGKVLTAGADGTASWNKIGDTYVLSADVQTAVQTLISAIVTDILTSSRTVPVRKKSVLTHSGASEDIAILDTAAQAFIAGLQVATPVGDGNYVRAIHAYRAEGAAQLEFYVPLYVMDIPGVGDKSFSLAMAFTGVTSSIVVSVIMQLMTDIT